MPLTSERVKGPSRAPSVLTALRFRAHAIRAAGPDAAFAFVVLWGALITWLSAQSPRSGDPRGYAAHLLLNSGHAPLFGFWAVGVAYGLAARIPRPIPDRGCAAAAFLLTILFGALDEWHQSFVVGRTSSWTDVLTDGVGAAVFLLCLRYLARERATAAGFVARVALGAAVVLAVAFGVTEADLWGWA